MCVPTVRKVLIPTIFVHFTIKAPNLVDLSCIKLVGLCQFIEFSKSFNQSDEKNLYIRYIKQVMTALYSGHSHGFDITAGL